MAEMGALRLEFGEDEAKHIGVRGCHPAQGAAHHPRLDRACLDHIDHAFHRGCDERRIGEADHRRGIDDDVIEPFLQVLDQQAHAPAGEQVGCIWRLRPGGKHHEPVPIGLAQQALEIIRAGQEVAHALLVGQVESVMDRGRAHIGIDQDDLSPRAGERQSERDRGGRFSFARPRAGDRERSRRAMRGGQLEVRLDRQIGLDQRRAGLPQCLERLGLDAGQRAEQGQAQFLLGFAGIAYPFVDLFERRRRGCAEYAAREHCQHEVDQQARLGRPIGQLCGIDDRDIVVLDTAGNADLLIALEQRVIELAVGVGVALVDVVLDAAPAQVGQIALEAVDPGEQRPFARHR